jgi:gliding motility-associated lipoprotein GldH
MKVKLSAILLGFVLLASCNDNNIYRQNKQIDIDGWNKDSTVCFVAPIADTINDFNIYISIRNTNNYPTENLYLFVKTISPQENFIVDTVNLYLADAYGKWLGKKVSRIWDNKFLFRKNVKFANTGEYTFIIQQGMRYDILDGISDVGIQIEQQN